METFMKILACLSEKTWTAYGFEYDCGYGKDVECGECVCSGGINDPRYNMDDQPVKMPKFIHDTMEYNQKRIDETIF
jgi:hypothetical protein